MKLPYFKLGEALKEVRDDFSWGSGTDKLTSVAKLMGKSVANVGMLAVDAGVAIAIKAPEITGKMAQKNLDSRSHLMSDGEIERHREMVKKGEDAREQRSMRDREEEKNREVEAKKRLENL